MVRGYHFGSLLLFACKVWGSFYLGGSRAFGLVMVYLDYFLISVARVGNFGRTLTLGGATFTMTALIVGSFSLRVCVALRLYTIDSPTSSTLLGGYVDFSSDHVVAGVFHARVKENGLTLRIGRGSQAVGCGEVCQSALFLFTLHERSSSARRHPLPPPPAGACAVRHSRAGRWSP